ncbi:endolytic transglycosylase MltG [Gordonia zhaorongruii]|uniref:endolytic transglycosylase MltG n=1 Tax=Gordonia zhaorongruii TaxID=2597659 RepID=UPI001F3EC352|nr:endolytic transglycosylase MltG [Gordonia zhaorongruii]
MTDQDRTPRHGEEPGRRRSRRDREAGRPGDESWRYFTDPGTGRSGTRHRRRRGPGDPTTTGSIPLVRTEGQQLPDPTVEYRTPEPPPEEQSPHFQVRYRSTEPESGTQFRDPSQEPERQAPQPIPRQPRPPEPGLREPGPGASKPGASESDQVTEPQDRPEPGRGRTAAVAGTAAAGTAGAAAAAAGGFDVLDDGPQDESSPGRPTTAAARGRSRPWRGRGRGVGPRTIPASAPGGADDRSAHDRSAHDRSGHDVLSDTDDQGTDGAKPKQRSNRNLLLAVGAIALIAILVVGGVGAKWLGLFDSREDFDSTTGSGAVIVEVPNEAALRDVGETLADAGVVGSRRAFVDAVESSGAAVTPGFYRLPKGISASTAIDKMGSPESRVGRFVVPEGLQLDSKQSANGSTRPGIFEMVEKATTFETDGEKMGVTKQELKDAAADADPKDLGVPDWAMAKVNELKGDHRRIEGLIASGAWENIDPRLDATEILRELITRSVTRFTTWGLLSGNYSGLSPYDTATVASIVEAEASKDNDFPKVARVILNRLKLDRRLEMDSTANYTAAISDIDLHGDAYTADNEWNTYHHDGLPVTPIGAVGERALRATEEPAKGKWLYFVTVDKDGKTLFANTFGQHRKNRQVACSNGFLSVNCE